MKCGFLTCKFVGNELALASDCAKKSCILLLQFADIKEKCENNVSVSVNSHTLYFLAEFFTSWSFTAKSDLPDEN